MTSTEAASQPGWHRDLQPATFDKLGKSETDLEDIIASNPHLLELEAQMDGVHGPFAIFRQHDLTNALELGIVPDLFIISASGHVVIVEVKLSTNPELRSRKVLAQLMDYASAFTSKSEEELVRVFNRGYPVVQSWEEVVAELFPESPHQETLASRLIHRLWSGEVNLIVACDKAPVGLLSLLSGVSRQSAVPFEFRLVEVTPYLRQDVGGEQMLLVSKTKLRTEIVSRSVVTVKHSGTEGMRPTVHVETTSLDDIEKRMAETDGARPWTNEEIEQAFEESENPLVRRLFELARSESYSDTFASPGPKRNPAFGFYVHGTGPDGTERTIQVFNYRLGESVFRIYRNMVETVVSEAKSTEFVDRLEQLFPESSIRDLREPSVPLNAVEAKFDEFRELILSLKEG